YEDLVAQPQTSLRKVTQFLNIPFSEEMLNFGESARKLVDKKEMQWKKETFGPLLTDNTQKWKKQLTAEQIYLIQKICSTTFDKHPYKKENVKVSLLTRIKAELFNIFAFVFKILYPLRLKFLK